jgi:hypothetical protein
MSISLYDASIPVFLRYLNRLDGLVEAAESHAIDHQIDLSTSSSISPPPMPFFVAKMLRSGKNNLTVSTTIKQEPSPPYFSLSRWVINIAA